MANMRELVAELEAKRARALDMGGKERIDKQHARGKLTARESFAQFFDDGVLFEVVVH